MGEGISEVLLSTVWFALIALSVSFLTVFYEFSYKKAYNAELAKAHDRVLYVKTVEAH